jgi:hypothetical protein
MGDIIALDSLGLSADVYANYEQNDALTSGVSASFGIMSYRGKVWRVTYGGETKSLLKSDGDPVPSIRVILLGANKNLSRIYYKKRYEDGDNEAPDCMSNNGQAPDPGAPKPQSSLCATCPQNQFGSRISDSGKQTKACAESRRMAVVPADDPENEAMGGPMLLRAPGMTARGPLKAYGKLLSDNRLPMHAVVTKVGFDPESAYPKLLFSIDIPATKAFNKKKGNRDAVAKWLVSEEVSTVLAETVVPTVDLGDSEAKAVMKEAAELYKQPAERPTVKDPDDVEIASADELNGLMDSIGI